MQRYKAYSAYTKNDDGTVTSTEASDGDTVVMYVYTIQTEEEEIIYKLVTDSGYLKTPIYGADGRVSKLDANTINATYNGKGFDSADSDPYGVRAVGVTSNISPEALALRNAKQTVRQAISDSKAAAIRSLSVDAAALANLIVQAKLNSSYTYSDTDYKTLQTAINNLDAIVVLLENALKEAVVAVGLSQGVSFTAADVTLSYANNEMVIAIAGDKEVTWTGDVLVSAKTDLNAAMVLL